TPTLGWNSPATARSGACTCAPSTRTSTSATTSRTWNSAASAIAGDAAMHGHDVHFRHDTVMNTMQIRLATFPLLLATALLAGCGHVPARNPLATWVPSPNHDLRRPVLIVIHYTEQDSVQRSLDTLRSRNSGGPVSAHYLIGRDGQRYQLVSDERRAWHGGA